MHNVFLLVRYSVLLAVLGLGAGSAWAAPTVPDGSESSDAQGQDFRTELSRQEALEARLEALEARLEALGVQQVEPGNTEPANTVPPGTYPSAGQATGQDETDNSVGGMDPASSPPPP